MVRVCPGVPVGLANDLGPEDSLDNDDYSKPRECNATILGHHFDRPGGAYQRSDLADLRPVPPDASAIRDNGNRS